MLDPKNIRHKGLKRFFGDDDGSKLNADWLNRIRRILNALDVAVHPEELRYPGSRLHELKGDREGTYSVTVSGNWRITFRWEDSGPYDVDLEDYHGR